MAEGSAVVGLALSVAKVLALASLSSSCAVTRQPPTPRGRDNHASPSCCLGSLTRGHVPSGLGPACQTFRASADPVTGSASTSRRDLRSGGEGCSRPVRRLRSTL
ncbi:hypothetical protein N658DRAFT_88206 [Parathielavia hyrcaniae]|uniref:Secreted protein n=1 Tax=Parathielavia hyrcaniae TaxID=113614 RepID=A0AAN6PZP2_9PEZI|nr:hypothetical protein N658DRAFT_88206 [Parathielavia hyrcaniae]